jgi:peptide/nickel transport system substrate-binding protein
MKRTMTRRELFAWTAKTGFGIGLAGALGNIMGCAQQPVPTAAPGAPSAVPTAAATPTKAAPKTQAAIIDLVNSFSKLNPATSAAVGEITINNAMFNKVTRIQPDGKPVPELIEELPKMEDPKTYLLKFRKGVKFHDGTEMKASDFKFTVDLIKNPDTASLFASLLDFVDSVELVDDYTARLHLKQSFGFLAERMAIIYVLPEKKYTELGDRFPLQPIGTGPFMFKGMTANEKVELARFSDYFRTGLPYLDTLTYRWVEEASARMANIMAGQSDIVEQVPPQSFDTFGTLPGIKTAAVDGTRMTGLFMNCGKKPFDDVRVRQALVYAIDRKAIIDTVFKGRAKLGNGTEIAPSLAYYNPNAFKYEYNPDKAKALLKEAGAEGFSFELMAGSLKFLSDTAAIMKPMYEAIGLQPQIRLTEVEAGYQYVFDKSFDTYVAWGNTCALGLDMDVNARWAYGPFEPNTSFWYWSGPEYDKLVKLLDDAAAESDDAKRRDMHYQIQQIVVDEVGDFIIAWADNLGAWKDDVAGYTPPANDIIEAEGIKRV